MRKLTLKIGPHWSDTAACALDRGDRRRCADERCVRDDAGSCCAEIEQSRDDPTRHPTVPAKVVGADVVSAVAQWPEAGRTDDFSDASPITCVSRG